MMTDSLKDREEDIISEFEMFDDWMDKYEYIIDLGKELEGLSFRKQKGREFNQRLSKPGLVNFIRERGINLFSSR